MAQRTDYPRLESRLGYRFKNRAHLIHALSPSAKLESRFQVLEFEGDGALRYVLPKLLAKRYPEVANSPGELSRMYHLLSCNESLAHMALRLQLLRYVKGGNSASFRAIKPLADVVESIIGAVDADGGIEAVEQVCKKIFRLDIELVRFDRPMDILTRLAAKEGLGRIEYRVIPTADSGQAGGHVCVLKIGQTVRSDNGSGFTSEWATRAAAAIALLVLFPGRFSTDLKNFRWTLRQSNLNGSGNSH